MTTIFAILRDRESSEIGDYIHSTVTTAINADTSIVDTSLANREGGGTTDYFKNWYALITSGANAPSNVPTKRIVSAYDGAGTSTVQGGNLTDDGATLATYELHQYDPDIKKRSINEAARQVYSVLFKPLRDRTKTVDKDEYEVELPSDFQEGELCQVRIEDGDYSASAPREGRFGFIWGWKVIDEEGTKYLKLNRLLSDGYYLELIGYCPLEDDLDDDADTMTIDGKYVSLLIMKAAEILYDMLSGTVSSDSIARYSVESLKWRDRYNRAKGRLRMVKPVVQIGRSL